MSLGLGKVKGRSNPWPICPPSETCCLVAKSIERTSMAVRLELSSSLLSQLPREGSLPLRTLCSCSRASFSFQQPCVRETRSYGVLRRTASIRSPVRLRRHLEDRDFQMIVEDGALNTAVAVLPFLMG